MVDWRLPTCCWFPVVYRLHASAGCVKVVGCSRPVLRQARPPWRPELPACQSKVCVRVCVRVCGCMCVCVPVQGVCARVYGDIGQAWPHWHHGKSHESNQVFGGHGAIVVCLHANRIDTGMIAACSHLSDVAPSSMARLCETPL